MTRLPYPLSVKKIRIYIISTSSIENKPPLNFPTSFTTEPSQSQPLVQNQNESHSRNSWRKVNTTSQSTETNLAVNDKMF